jgi:hypothetical protein
MKTCLCTSTRWRLHAVLRLWSQKTWMWVSLHSAKLLFIDSGCVVNQRRSDYLLLYEATKNSLLQAKAPFWRAHFFLPSDNSYVFSHAHDTGCSNTDITGSDLSRTPENSCPVNYDAVTFRPGNYTDCRSKIYKTSSEHEMPSQIGLRH